MELTLEQPGEHLFIRSVSSRGIQVVDDFHTAPIIVSASELVTDWPVAGAGDLDEEHLEALLALDPEVVLIGTGERQVFLPPALTMVFYRRGVGIEVMATGAACRTFNVLVSESRNVVAGLLPLQPVSGED